MRRLHRKIEQNRHVYEKYEEHFTDDAEILVVSWGGVTARPALGGAVLKAREEASKPGYSYLRQSTRSRGGSG